MSDLVFTPNPNKDSDFGFSFEGDIKDQHDIKGVLDMIDPFLKRLMTNPTQEYIKWPNRVSEVEKFRNKLYAYAGMSVPVEYQKR